MRPSAAATCSPKVSCGPRPAQQAQHSTACSQVSRAIPRQQQAGLSRQRCRCRWAVARDWAGAACLLQRMASKHNQLPPAQHCLPSSACRTATRAQLLPTCSRGCCGEAAAAAAAAAAGPLLPSCTPRRGRNPAHLQSTAKPRLAGGWRPRARPVLSSRKEAATSAREHGGRRRGCCCCVVGAGAHGAVVAHVSLRPPVCAPSGAAAAPGRIRAIRACCCCCCVCWVVAATPAPPAAVARPDHGRRLEAPLHSGGGEEAASSEPGSQRAACSPHARSPHGDDHCLSRDMLHHQAAHGAARMLLLLRCRGRLGMLSSHSC